MFTFKKIERLSSKKDIELLYHSGRSKNFFPLKVYWRANTFESPYPLRILISVPKRNHKKAVDRNLVKRRIREAFRLQKHAFYSRLSGAEKKADIMFLYSGKEILELPAILKLVQDALAHAVDELLKNTPNNVKENSGKEPDSL